MFCEPQVEIVYPNGKKEWVPMEYEDGTVKSLYPNGQTFNPIVSLTLPVHRTRFMSSEQDDVPINDSLMEAIKDIDHNDLKFL